ncbi:aldo/keto reductase [Arthrobacter crystallopoietes BAB-32]|uniref:Aldo/keto reductase n=1 Tax=Arthrobacter crystallopoietes BAB-32 TaxID=1246476 RepID=N1V5J2_9MICC|nr:aldo/keto reductase [Arthrobacter crystallopoietes]EMY33533.1 aldo/keto reductase [Arthrobacter crystallopoietes BAB-32]
MTVDLAPLMKLRNGARIPLLGLGTWPLDNAQTAAAVEQALATGYRLIDTAENYGNEAGVGEGVRRSGLPREDVFITTKFNKEWHSYDGVRRAFEASAARLGVEYVDLLLIHWPNPGQDRYVEAFEGMAALLKDGLVKAIGTSNFKPAHLRRLFDAGLVPEVNQIQLDPRHTRSDLVELHREYGIATESWSPLGRGGSLLREPATTQLADKYGRTPAQIVLRWQTQQGFIAIPKSSRPERLAENFGIFDFVLDGDELATLSALDTGVADIYDADDFGH